MTRALSSLALAHRRAVATAWVVLTVAGAWAASTLSDQLSQSFDAPGKPAFEANRDIVKNYRSGGIIDPIVLVSPEGDTGELRAVARSVRGARTVIGGPDLSTHDGAEVALVFPPPGAEAPNENLQAIGAARDAARGTGVAVSGKQALNEGSGGGGAGLLIEVLAGALGALVVLAVVFASWLALVPILLAACSILTTFLVLRGLAAGFDISFVVQFLVGLIGLGVAIDYSLLLIVRWREERDEGHSSEEAVRRAMDTAGHAILISGTTVAIGLVALVAVPVPFIRSIGVGGLLIPLVSVLATLTLLPGLLAAVGPRLDRRRKPGQKAEDRTAWFRWSRWVVRRRWLAAVVGIVITGALAVAALGLNPGEPSVDALAKSGPARAGLQAIERGGLGSGTLTPVEAVVPAGGVAQARERLSDVPGVRAVLAPTSSEWSADGTRALAVLPRQDAASDAGKETLDALRDLDGPRLAIGGPNAQDRDLTEEIYGSFPLMVVLIALLTFVLLYRALRSVVLPIKAILLNMFSVAAAFGVVVLIWQDGHGSELIAGLPGTGAITNWVPLSIFAFLYGLSMDYEVFILSRMREEYDRTGSTDEAVVRGLGHTGRLVTSAALILFLAFVALFAGPQTQLKILATGLAAGILLDATVVRALIVPALVSLLGRGNWWHPRHGSEPVRPAEQA